MVWICRVVRRAGLLAFRVVRLGCAVLIGGAVGLFVAAFVYGVCAGLFGALVRG